MAFFSTSTLIPHLRPLARSAHRIPHIPPTRLIFTGQPRAPAFPVPPPARRHFERAPSTHTPPKPNPTPTSESAPARGPPDQRPTANATTTRTTIPRRPTNRQIPFDHVFVLDPDTNKLSPAKRSLEALLLETRQPEKRGVVVELVASTPAPIVRLTTRIEVEARYREMKQALKKGARVGEESKEVQLTWGVGRADLEHKLRKARRDLEKGYRVVVVLKTKRGQRPSNRQEWVAFADEISETLCEVGEEWKEREVTERTMSLWFRKAALDDDVS